MRGSVKWLLTVVSVFFAFVWLCSYWTRKLNSGL